MTEMKSKEDPEVKDERLFKFILKCCRNHYKPDVHTFFIRISEGRAYVECREHEVFIIFYYDGKPSVEWCGTPVAAANRLEKHGADIDTIDM